MCMSVIPPGKRGVGVEVFPLYFVIPNLLAIRLESSLDRR